MGAGHLHPDRSVLGLGDLIADPLQREADHLAQISIVIDDKYSRHTGPAGTSSGRFHADAVVLVAFPSATAAGPAAAASLSTTHEISGVDTARGRHVRQVQ